MARGTEDRELQENSRPERCLGLGTAHLDAKEGLCCEHETGGGDAASKETERAVARTSSSWSAVAPP